MSEVLEITVPHNFRARSYQEPVFDAWDEGIKRFLVCAHRRAGKDTLGLNFCIPRMLERVGSYYHFFPVSTQGRKIIWDGYNREGFPFLGYFPEELIARKNDQEMKIELVNGSIYQIVGTDRALDWIVGNQPSGRDLLRVGDHEPDGLEPRSSHSSRERWVVDVHLHAKG